ncbi:MAG: ATP-binding protein [Candidatus Zambryskibacteria bacterium]|nr:ATP-binding protein [Candidatus Zambryskibacteria bacterium]
MIENQLTLLNETTLESLNETDEIKIVKNFTEVGLKVLGADFGFVWLNSSFSRDLKLVYKSAHVPFTPNIPRKGGRNYTAIENSTPDFITETENTPDAHYVSKHVKSFAIIPLVYKEAVYGSIVFCFKKREVFHQEKKILSTFIGTSVAQSITISRLIMSERDARIFSEKQEAHFRGLIENSYEIIAHIHKSGKILFISKSVERILGFSIDDIIGKNINEFTYTLDCKRKLNYMAKISRNPGMNHVVEFCSKHKDGSVLQLESISSSKIGDKTMGGIVVNIRDVTERKKFELIKETKRLLEEERLKIESIADATHELRTPLAIIKGNVDLALLKTSKRLKSPQSAFRAIDHEIKHLSNILADLTLITSKKEESKHKVVYEKVDIGSLVKKVVQRFKVLSAKKNITISVLKMPRMSVVGDTFYLEKMLANLIKNSITYGNRNGHTCIEVNSSQGFAVFTVSDDGVGIKEADLPHVFERFYKGDKSHKSDGQSTGLGLAIVKWIAEIHGGTVSVKRRKEKGTVFTVSLPIQKVVK